MAKGYGQSYGNSYGLADPVMLLLPLPQLLPLQGLSQNLLMGISSPPVGAYGLWDSPTPAAGAFVLLPANEVAPQESAGAYSFSFFDDFYNRMHVSPVIVDFGIITAETTRTLTIWNAHLDQSVMVSSDLSTLDDFNIGLNAAPPIVFDPLETKVYTLTAAAAGPTEVDGSIFFTFNPTEVIQVSVEGLRGKLWPFLPNWASPVRQSWEYRTEILSSRTGREQRIAQREIPRKRVEFISHVRGDGRRELNRLLDKYQNVEFTIPDLPRRVFTTESMVAGASEVSIDAFPDWLVPGSLVVLVYGKRSQMRYVEDVDEIDGLIVFDDVSVESWPAGTRICFALAGYLDDAITTRRLTDEVVEISCRLSTTPGREVPFDPGLPSDVYQNREVFLARPDWSDPVALTYERETEVIDYGKGIARRFTPAPMGVRVARATYLNRDYETADKIFRLFVRMRGQRGEFYLPTWENDLILKTMAPSGSSLMRIGGKDIADAYANNRVFKDLMVVLKDGTKIFRTVVSIYTAEESGSVDTFMQMHTGWPYNIHPDDVHLICWMPVARFASDTLSIDWLTDTKSQFQITTRTLENLPAEI